MPTLKSKARSAQTYTIYLLKDEVASVKDALDPEKHVTGYDLIEGLGFSGTLFVGGEKQYEPVWVQRLGPFLTSPVRQARASSISAVLIIEYEKRLFAVTFGYGKGLLRKSSWFRDFGLKVTLNRVDPAKLRSIDTKTYEDIVVSTRKQTSRSSTLGSFELDVARDLLRAVTGVATDTTFFERLAGADSITLTTKLAFRDFGDLLDELLVAYGDDRYKKSFGWIDNIKEVDLDVRLTLDSQVVSALQNEDTENMHLAPAEIVEWNDIRGFNYTTGKKSISYPELELADYLEVLGKDCGAISIDQLKRHNVRVRFGDSELFVDQWSVYECLVWDTELNGKKYVLFDGRWFEVDKIYAKTVDEYVRGLSASKAVLPDSQLGVSEETYNESVADNAPAQFVLFDRQPIRAARATTSIEFCDLLSVSGQLIHVKKRSSSATLSHLFSQGSVSADVFLQDASARAAIRSKLKKLRKRAYIPLIPAKRPVPNKYEVIYAVLAKNSSKWPPPLPFFSAVNLMHHAGRIQNLGFEVSLHHVRER